MGRAELLRLMEAGTLHSKSQVWKSGREKWTTSPLSDERERDRAFRAASFHANGLIRESP